MADILNELNAAKTAAMKAKGVAAGAAKDAAELRLTVLRGVISEIESDSKQNKPRGEAAVLKSEHSKRVESSKIYGEAGEQSRSEREGAEAEIVAEFFEFLPEEPKQPTELELQHFIADFVGANGLKRDGLKAKGQVMRVVRQEFDSFDGRIASALADKILTT